MRKSILVLVAVALISYAGVCFAETESDCFDKCTSPNNYKTPNNASYCKETCSRTQEEYPSQQLEILKQQLELQKQSLEIQKQQLEVQRQQLEQAKQDVQEPTPADAQSEP